MTRSTKAIYKSVLRDMFLLSCKLLCIAVSLALLGFVGFHIMGVH